MKIKEIYDFLNTVAPFDTAAEWDNTGMSIGSLHNEVSRVIVALDVTNEVIEKAVESGAQLVITHHPLIFAPVNVIEQGSVLYNAVKSGVTFISSHTCLDKAEGGVTDCLAEKVGVTSLYNSKYDEFLKVGEIAPCSVEEFAQRVKKSLGCSVAYTDCGKAIGKVGFCSGSGGDLVFAAAKEGADALLTGEAKHHEYLASKEVGVALFSAGHYETENIICDVLCSKLKNEFKDLDVEVYGENPVLYI